MTGAISRRSVLAGGAAALVGQGLLSAAPAEAAAAPRGGAARATGPNILWLVSEDNGPFLGAYGDEVARTPNLDRFATEAVRYAACFSAAPVCAPSRFALITGLYAQTSGPAHHMRAEGKGPAWLRGFPELLRAQGYYCTNNAKTDYNVPVDLRRTWDENSTRAHWRNRPAGAPFFSVFNTFTTHEGQMATGATQPLAGGVSPADVRIPEYLPDTDLARRERAHYYDQVTRMDAEIGELLRQLDEDGLAEDTIVFYYSDNGGVLPRTKRFCYDSGTHTPLMIRFPRAYAALSPTAPGSVVRTPVSSVDFAPTVLSLVGLPKDERMQGIAFAGPARKVRRNAFSARDRMGERYDMQRSVRNVRYRYIRNYLPHLPYGQHEAYGWHQPGYREWERLHLAGRLDDVQSRFWQPKPAEELYDLATDQDEVRNLVGDPAHARVLAELRTALDAHLLAVNDNGFIAEGSAPEGYAASRVRGRYPLARVLTVAGTAIQRRPSDVGRLEAWLRDPDAVVRLWAARGCRMLPGGAPSAAPVLRDLLADRNVPVQVAAADALVVSGDVEQGLATLSRVLLGAPEWSFRLQAANALDSLGPLARGALPALRSAAQEKHQYVSEASAHTVEVLEGRYRP